MGFFHVNPANPKDDFMVLSPLDPDRELGVYTPEGGRHKWFFCPKCGVRCFAVGGNGGGKGEVVSVASSELGLGDNSGDREDGKREVWRAKWDGKDETMPYVSINGITIDWSEDFDMRVLTEEKRVQYFDDKSEPEAKKKDPRWERPHYGGCY
jgi:hypothetical protein